MKVIGGAGRRFRNRYPDDLLDALETFPRVTGGVYRTPRKNRQLRVKVG